MALLVPASACVRTIDVETDIGVCVEDAPVVPIDAFVLGPGCAPENLLVEDGMVAGADISADGACGLLGNGDGSCGCVGVDLGSVYPIGSVRVVAGPTNNACGGMCFGGRCDTGHTMQVSSSLDRETWSPARPVRFMEAGLGEFFVSLNEEARFVVACRDNWGVNRDDVVVDVIEPFCGVR